jgi:hypothetical protein
LDPADVGADPAELSGGHADPGLEPPTTGLDPAVASLNPPEPGMWLTASTWLPAALLDALREPEPTEGNRALQAALSQGGPLDAMPPGPVLAAFLTEASAPAAPSAPPAPSASPPSTATPDSVAARIASGADLAQHGDNALLGLIRGWRRVASLAAAAEMAAVNEFSRRRHDQAKAEGAWDSTAIDAADVELAAALTLTTRSTQLLMDRAAMLHELPATAAALAAGQIDWPRALVLITGLAGQDPGFVRRIEQQLIGRAPQQTTGQLRAALNRALLAADPEAAERRRQNEEQQARIERGPEPGGVTALLAGRCLPVTDTVTAWNRITAMARQLRTAGADGDLDQLRVHVYLALLNGQTITAPDADDVLRDPAGSPPSAVPPPSGPVGSRGHASPSAPTSAPLGPATEIEPRRLTGHINLTVPLGTLAGFDDGPGHLTGFGPITGSAARQLANSALGQAGVRWCVTVTNDQGQAVGHGCATRIQPMNNPAREGSDLTRSRAAPAGAIAPGTPAGPSEPSTRAAPGESGWRFTVTLTALAGAACDHTRESSHYRPPPSLRHLVETRNACCTAPGCRMAACVCDDDHSVPFGQGGRTCECNLGPLCRHHHRVKQAQGWRLTQPEPGVFVWNTPSGRFYTTGPTHHIA